MPPRFSPLDVLILLGILVFAAVLRWTAIDTESLWLDEGYSWWDARQSLHDLWTLVPQCDPHPPLYFLLLKVWIGLFGDSLTAMRSLSSVFGVATVGMVILTGRAITPGIGWLAGMMFAAAPFQIYFAHEARPYALLCFGAALLLYGAVWVVLRIQNLETPGQEAVRQDAMRSSGKAPAAWLSLVLGAAIMVWTNNTVVLHLCAVTLAFVLIFIIDPRSRRFALAVLFAAIAVLLLWSPYLPQLYDQVRGVSSAFWIQKPTFWSMGDEFRHIFGFNSSAIGWWMIVVMLCGLALLFKGNWQLALMLFSLSALPVLLNIAFSLTIKPIFISRAFIGVAPAFIIATAAAITLLRNRCVRAALIIVMIGLHGFTVTSLLQSNNLKEPWRKVVTSLVQQAGPVTATNAYDSVILMISNEMTLSLTYTLSHAPFVESQALLIPQHGIPADYPAPGLDARYPSGKCDPSIEGFSMAPVDHAVQGRKQVFLITRRNNTYDPDNSIRAHLLEQGWVETSMVIYQPGDLQLHRFVQSIEPAPSMTKAQGAQ